MAVLDQSVERQYRILIVEDSRADIWLIRHALQEQALRCELVIADDGGRALELLCEGSMYDLVLIDLNLPSYDGAEVLRHARGISSLARVPVAVFSSSESPSDQDRVRSLGATCFLRKPTGLDDFLAVGGVLKRLCEHGA